MHDTFVSPILGAVLFVFGLVLMRSHVLAWRIQKNDSQLDDKDRKHYYRRYRRRMQTSGMIAGLGVVIPLEIFIARNQPILFTFYVAVVLLVALWIVALGIADFVATRAHTRAALARIRGKQRALEKQLAEIKSRGSNGHYES